MLNNKSLLLAAEVKYDGLIPLPPTSDFIWLCQTGGFASGVNPSDYDMIYGGTPEFVSHSYFSSYKSYEVTFEGYSFNLERHQINILGISLGDTDNSAPTVLFL